MPGMGLPWFVPLPSLATHFPTKADTVLLLNGQSLICSNSHYRHHSMTPIYSKPHPLLVIHHKTWVHGPCLFIYLFIYFFFF